MLTLSRFRWYMNAAICYAYLSDVPGTCPVLSDDNVNPKRMEWISAFEESRWFRRGWTLQELIAPGQLFFFGEAWNCIGSLSGLLHRVSSITNIQVDVLDGTRPLADLSIACRMSWASRRQTSRIEDQAYSLFGILCVSMPLVYGEGRKAFQRLQQEIIRQSTDQSIFAWDSPQGSPTSRKGLLLAPSIQCFQNGLNIERHIGRAFDGEGAYTINNRGLEIVLAVLNGSSIGTSKAADTGAESIVAILDCKYKGSSKALGLNLKKHTHARSDRKWGCYVQDFQPLIGSSVLNPRLVIVAASDIHSASARALTIMWEAPNFDESVVSDDKWTNPSWTTDQGFSRPASPLGNISVAPTDSGYDSMSFQSKTRYLTQEDVSDSMSIQTDGRSYDIQPDRKEALIGELADELASEVKGPPMSKTRQTNAELEDLLRDFSILLEKASAEKLHREAATFVRHQRKHIVRKYAECIEAWQPEAGPTSQDRIDLLLDRFVPEHALDPDERTTELDLVPSQFHYDQQQLSDVDKARDFLLSSSELVWLRARFKFWESWQQTGNTYNNIRKEICNHIDRSSFTITTTTYLTFQWNPIDFLRKEYQDSPRKLSTMIVYCGTVDCAYAVTVFEYVCGIWPDIGKRLLDCIEGACEEKNSGRNAVRVTEKARLEVALRSPGIQVWVSGPASYTLEIAEALVWLSTACRNNGVSEQTALCIPRLLTKTHKAGNTMLYMTPTYERVDASQASCWLGMVRNPVIAQGYPVPRRDEINPEKGLEAALDILVALSHADWATSFGPSFVIKGALSALVPVLKIGSSLVWHFLLNAGRSRMTYNQACTASARLEGGPIFIDNVNSHRHFVGLWTGTACIKAGSNDESLYNIQLSSSERADKYQWEFSNVSVSAGKIIGLSTGFRLSRKDIPLTFSQDHGLAYEIEIEQASDTNVLLYSTQDRRAWLLDGASALLHLARCWMSSKNARFMFSNVISELQCVNPRGGREAALQTLKQNKTRNIRIFDSSTTQSESVYQTSISDSGYGTTSTESKPSRKNEQKTTSTSWTYGDLVRQQWHILEAMNDRLIEVKERPPTVSPKFQNLKWVAVDRMGSFGVSSSPEALVSKIHRAISWRRILEQVYTGCLHRFTIRENIWELD